MAGVVIGVAALLIVLSVTNGFQTEIEAGLVGTNAHLSVLPAPGSAGLVDVAGTLAAVRAHPEVVAAAPFVFGKAIVAATGGVDGLAIKGVAPVLERRVTRVLARAEPAVTGPRLGGILLGSKIAGRLGVGRGDTVTLTAASAASVAPRVAQLRVAGTFTSGIYEFDSSLGLIDLDVARDLFGVPGASGIAVTIRNVYAARTVAHRLAQDLGPDFQAENWMDQNSDLLAWITKEKIVILVVLSLIVLVATFNLVSSLSMAVIEKRRDIGILRSMGATSGVTQRIFVAMGGLIGLVGTGTGTAIGILGSLGLSRVRIPGGVYFVDRLPVRIEARDVLVVAAISLALCLLATAIPSRRAARLDPVEAIRTGE